MLLGFVALSFHAINPLQVKVFCNLCFSCIILSWCFHLIHKLWSIIWVMWIYLFGWVLIWFRFDAYFCIFPSICGQFVPHFWWKQPWIAGRAYSFLEGGTQSHLWLLIHVSSFSICISISKLTLWYLFSLLRVILRSLNCNILRL